MAFFYAIASVLCVSVVCYLAHATQYDEYNWCILNSMTHIRYFNDCSDFSNYSSTSIQFEGMKGEYENSQLIFEYNTNPPSNISFQVSNFVNTTNNVQLPSSIITLYQVGNVNCSSNIIYAGSGGGWRPDPIFELNDNLYGNIVPVSSAYSQGIWINIHIPYNSKPIIYSGNITVSISNTNTHFSIPITLNVWNITIPTTFDSKFQTVFGFNEYNLPNFYNSSIYNITEIQYKYFDLLSSFRVPPDEPYLGGPRPIADYKYLTTKTAWSNIEDVQAWLLQYNCTNYTNQEIQKIINSVNTSLLQLQANGMDINLFYVYGFDEVPSYCLSGMYKVFNTLTSIWPKLRTMSAIDWGFMPPLNLSLNAWVVIYYEYNEDEANNWVNNGVNKQQWLYHSIDPPDINALNTFIERPLMDSRILFWLGAKYQAQGWLYYAINLWNGCPSKGIPNKHIIGGYTNNLTFTDFDPANYIWCPNIQYFANGDGYYIYPGKYGPVPSVRLQNIRDGLEDIELLRMLNNKQDINNYVNQIVVGPRNYTLNPILLQKIRKQVAMQVLLQ